ncbi:MBL fold metallo-hydrolase [Saccharopolyspora rhizosphaerae]|uniref:MBL fold metallo-hydrolase n=1 Tax=Saccharopolyspora rhizosphaerae TaxID=2492662 RepID=A0A426K041_9PSEU|nr:MBL fold metallo-hydrolase [Saccharopolyspora rhizosphaerae]RRO18691.1 MBL fold metallo-hydrolase [Saccharopolyspora rhizosphaerae]
MSDATLPTGADCTLTFVGTATTLLRLGPFTLLTDPNFVRRGQWIYIGHGIVTKRRTNPAMTIDELPPLDAVVLSHLHGDHFDRVAERELDRDLPLVTTPHAADKLRKCGFAESVPMPRWSQWSMSKDGAHLTVTSLPGRHARGVVGVVAPPVMGTLLDYEPPGRRRLRMYISGDTIMHADLAEIRRRYPDIDLALVHLGGTRLLGHLLSLDHEEGADLLELLRPRQAVPIHHSDYGLFTSPLSEFQVEVARRGIPGVVYVLPGRPHDIALPAPHSG